VEMAEEKLHVSGEDLGQRVLEGRGGEDKGKDKGEEMSDSAVRLRLIYSNRHVRMTKGRSETKEGTEVYRKKLC
jgi:hypothetical protein